MKRKLVVLGIVGALLIGLVIVAYSILFPNESLVMEDRDLSHLQTDSLAVDDEGQLQGFDAMSGSYISVPDSSELFFLNGGEKGTSGRFNDFEVSFDRDSTSVQPEISVVIQSKSLFTDNDIRDSHLQEAEFFNTSVFPEITFESTGIQQTDSNYVAIGEMTFLGVKEEISIQFDYRGSATNLNGKQYHVLEGGFTFNPRDYGMDVGMVIADISDVKFYLELIRSE